MTQPDPLTTAADPRDSRPESEMQGRDAMFRDHNCWRCRDGAQPCRQGSPRGCEYPRARND